MSTVTIATVPHATSVWQACWAIGGWSVADGEPVAGYGPRIEFPGDVDPDWIETEVLVRLAFGWRQRYGPGIAVLLDDRGRLHTGLGDVAETPALLDDLPFLRLVAHS